MFCDLADDEYGQKSVSVMIDGQETELEVIDHPASEMSVSLPNENFYSLLFSDKRNSGNAVLEDSADCFDKDAIAKKTLHFIIHRWLS